jgi:hypothetical protein
MCDCIEALCMALSILGKFGYQSRIEAKHPGRDRAGLELAPEVGNRGSPPCSNGREPPKILQRFGQSHTQHGIDLVDPGGGWSEVVQRNLAKFQDSRLA